MFLPLDHSEVLSTRDYKPLIPWCPKERTPANQGVNLLCREGNSQPGHWMKETVGSWLYRCYHSRVGSRCWSFVGFFILVLTLFSLLLLSFQGEESEDKVKRGNQQCSAPKTQATSKDKHSRTAKDDQPSGANNDRIFSSLRSIGF